MTEGLSQRVAGEFQRRGRLVRVELELELGTLESLQLLMEARHGEQTRDEVVREALRWFVAREARSIVELEAIRGRRRERERLEADAVAFSRQERDQRDERNELRDALRIVDRWLSRPEVTGE